MKTPAEIIARIQERLGKAVLAAHAEGKHPRIHVAAADLRGVIELVREDPEIRLDYLRCLSGIDYAADGQMAVSYDLWSFEHRHTFAIKAYAPRENPAFPTISDLYPAANWHEREAFDLLGIRFEKHPNLARILCSDDWVGHPLRKDYEFPTEVHGIPATAPAVPEPRKPHAGGKAAD